MGETMNKQEQAFSIGGLELLSSMLAKQNNMRVIFGGNKTCIDHSTKPMTVYLPGDLANTEVNKLIITAKIYHEAAHGRFTDFHVKNWHRLVNILEDVRIERLMGNRYIGCKQVLKKRWEVMRNTIAWPSEDEGLMQNVEQVIYFKMRHEIIDHPLGDFGQCAETLVRKHIPGDIVDQILMLSRSASNANGKDTQHVSDCTTAILKLLFDQQDKNEPPPQSQEDDSSESGEASQDESKGEGDDDDSDTSNDASDSSSDESKNDEETDGNESESSSSQDEGTDSTDKSDAEPGNDKNDPEQANGENDEAEQDSGQSSEQDEKPESSTNDKNGSSPDDQKEQNDHSDNDTSDQAKGNGFSDDNSDDDSKPGWQKLLEQSQDQSSQIDDEEMIDQMLERDYRKDDRVEEIALADVYSYAIHEAHSKRVTNQLRSQLEGLLQAMAMSDEYHVTKGGQLDRRCLHTLRTPNPKPFLREDEGEALDTAIQFLIDASSSMSGNSRSLIANEAAYALAQSTYNIQGVVSATAHFQDEHVVSVNQFDEKPDGRQFGIQASGGTPMTMALHWCLHQLWPREEARKIVIFLTDGQVGSNTVDKIDYLTKHGIECYGIGLGADLSHILPAEKQASIKQTSDLPNAMFGVLRKALFN